MNCTKNHSYQTYLAYKKKYIKYKKYIEHQKSKTQQGGEKTININNHDSSDIVALNIVSIDDNKKFDKTPIAVKMIQFSIDIDVLKKHLQLNNVKFFLDGTVTLKRSGWFFTSNVHQLTSPFSISGSSIINKLSEETQQQIIQFQIDSYSAIEIPLEKIQSKLSELQITAQDGIEELMSPITLTKKITLFRAGRILQQHQNQSCTCSGFKGVCLPKCRGLTQCSSTSCLSDKVCCPLPSETEMSSIAEKIQDVLSRTSQIRFDEKPRLLACLLIDKWINGNKPRQPNSIGQPLQSFHRSNQSTFGVIPNISFISTSEISKILDKVAEIITSFFQQSIPA